MEFDPNAGDAAEEFALIELDNAGDGHTLVAPMACDGSTFRGPYRRIVQFVLDDDGGRMMGRYDVIYEVEP